MRLAALGPAGLAALGRWGIGLLAGLGRFWLFVLRAIAQLPRALTYPREWGRAALSLGWRVLPIVGVTAAVTGAALVLQFHQGAGRLAADAVVPQITAIAIVRELGPVMVGLMLAARLTSALAAELATMRIKGEIDAFEIMGISPIAFLITPRLITGIAAAPLLVGVGDALGLAGGFALATQQLGYGPEGYIHASWSVLNAADLIASLIKGAAFGAIATAVGCFVGFHAGGGARGVGQATTRAVQWAAVLILAANVPLSFIGQTP